MIVLPPDGREELLERAAREGDREICGVFGGSYGQDRSVIGSTVHTDNVASSPRHEYEIGAEELFETIQEIEAAGEEVVGFFHSHPMGPSGPSQTDARRATWTDYSYAIVDLCSEPSIGSWRWRGSFVGFDRESLVREPAP